MISSTAEYALRAARHLAMHLETSCPARELAEATRIPGAYVSKVLQDLARAGLVHSQRGPKGGFALAREPSEISLLEVIDAVDPIRRIETCPLALPHGRNLCKLHRSLDEAIGMVQRAFAAAVLSDLLDDGDAAGCPAECGAVRDVAPRASGA